MNYENKSDEYLVELQQQLIYACEHVGQRAQDYDDFRAIQAELNKRDRVKQQQHYAKVKAFVEQREHHKQVLLNAMLADQ